MVVRKLKAPGGMIHVHHDGRRVFVRAGGMFNAWGASGGPPSPQPGIRLPYSERGRGRGTYSRGPVPGGQPLAGAPPQTAASQAAEFAPDASYFADIARQRFEAQRQLEQFQREGAEDLTAHTESLRRFNEQEPLAQQNANEGYNRQGLFYSGALGTEKARLATQYTRARADMQANFRARENARAEARRALEAGASIEEAAALAAAVDRGIDRDTEAADANALVPNVPQAPTVPALAPPSLTAPRRPARKPRGITVGRGTSARLPNPRARSVPRLRPVSRPTASPTRRRRRRV